MASNMIGQETALLSELTLHREEFEERFGKRAGIFLQHLPPLFRLFHRISFELEVPVALRQRAAAVAVYIAEAQDFMGEESQGVFGLIDDVWIAYTVLCEIGETVPLDVLQRHWRSETPLEEVIDLSFNICALRDKVPSRVLHCLRGFLGQPQTPAAS